MKKSKVKLNGVKAVYHISPDVRVIAAFGRGNNSVLDKHIENGSVEELQNHSDIEVNISRKTYSFRKKSLKKDAGQFSVPDNTNDQLGIREELEEEIFGRKFDDNIHIQAAYAVNDIIKMLAVAANLAETAINGLDRKNTENDMIGFYIIPHITYQKYAGNKKPKFDEFIGRVKAQGTFSYFPDILPKFKKEESEEESDNEKLYYIMCIISLIRNSATHSKSSNSDTTDYIFGEFNSVNKKALTATADNLIKSKIDFINKEGFSKNQKNNIYRLLKAGADTTENTARPIRRLYAFTIRKQDKNLGFSLKKLRECAIRS
ncbi:MAG: type VI-D CRISPR-associated RNA-guided ribonuclease Cas13d, partial [Clostridia bacterium]|nr:type VI-D CRISPR-associated RNA-guided ribonuclease Cas13d [Clostridia bacterium]